MILIQKQILMPLNLMKLTYNDIYYKKELKVMDSTSTTLCKDNNIPIIVFSMDIPGNITKAAKGEEVGTIVRGE